MITPEEVKSKTIERFWSKVKFGEIDECWEWQAGLSQFGYAKFRWRKDNKHITIDGHRFIYTIFHPEFNKTLLVLHRCDNRKCCNPNHLWIGTNQDNMFDKKIKGRSAKGSKNVNSKLDEEKVKIIKIRLADKETAKSIAELFKVDPSIIGDIKNLKTWKHVSL